MLHEHRRYTICEDRWSGEYIAIDTDTNIPHKVWWDAGNMWGNREMAITWDDVVKLDESLFTGINADNWRLYAPQKPMPACPTDP